MPYFKTDLPTKIHKKSGRLRNRLVDYLQRLSAFIRFSLKAEAFSAFSLFLLADLIIQHYVTPDHWICIYDFVKNVFYLFHNVILSFLVKH
jgi:hypothetical protein